MPTMPIGRSSKPLFDLVRDQSRGAVLPRRVEPRDATPDRHAAGATTPGEDGHARNGAVAVSAGSDVRIPVNAIYFAAAILVLILIGVWVGGVTWGQERAKRDLLPLIQSKPPDVRDPLTVGSGGTPAESSSGPKGGSPGSNSGSGSGPKIQPPPTKQPQPQGVPAPPIAPDGKGPIITSKGRTSIDPRSAGVNYLALVSNLPGDEAARLIPFLAAGGLEAIAVPVDRSGAGANNPGPAARYRIFALAGFSSERFRESQPAREELERTVTRLGQAWQREQKGSTNLAKPGWEKFQP